MAQRPSRDLALDLLRGCFLCAIAVNHLRYPDNPLHALTGASKLWVTAAEGFILVSGFLVGKLRGDEVRRAGLRPAARHLLRRAVTLAAWGIGLSIAYRGISELTGYVPGVSGSDTLGELGPWLVDALLLRRPYGNHDLLGYYALWLAIAPVGLFLMARGRTASFLLLAVALWAVSFATWIHWSTTEFLEGGWQLLFSIAMALGFHHDALAARWRALPERRRRGILVAGALVSAAIVAGAWIRQPEGFVYPTVVERLVFERHRLGPGRIVCALIVIGTMYGLASRFSAVLVPTVGRVLVPLGQNSLYVYIVQSMVTFWLMDRTLEGPWLALAASVAEIALLWMMVRHRVLFGIIPR